MRARSGIGSLILVALTFGCSSLHAAPIAPGNGQQTADLNGTKLVVYTYRPRCSNPKVLFVFHGLNRNADGYRDHARPLGDRLCALIVAPQFDQDRFPARKYQRGGIVDARGRVEPPTEWTGQLVVELGDWLWRQEGPAARILDDWSFGRRAVPEPHRRVHSAPRQLGGGPLSPRCG